MSDTSTPHPATTNLSSTPYMREMLDVLDVQTSLRSRMCQAICYLIASYQMAPRAVSSQFQL